MKILSIDTSNIICSSAYVELEKIQSDFYIKKIDQFNTNEGFMHSINLFKDLECLIKNNKIDFKKIDYITVASGPGSYTGLRIGVAAALGLSKPNKIKIKYVSSLYALSYNVDIDCDFIISIIDAKVDRVYFCLYDKNKNQLIEEQIVNINELIILLNKYFIDYDKKFVLVGDAVINYKNIIENDLKINYSIVDDNYNNAVSVALASLNVKSSKLPVVNYMQKSQAERNFDDRT